MMIRVGVGLVAAMIFSACSGGYHPPPAPVPVAACREGEAPLSPDQLDQCLRGFSFDKRYEYSDEQPLTIIEKGGGGPPCPGDPDRKYSCRYGPLATIEPVIRAHAYSEEDLMEGRFIARITVPRGEPEYPKYGLRPGAMTYWWVKTDSTGSAGDSYFITRAENGTISHVRRDLVREPYGDGTGYQDGKPNRALVRWLWTLDDETAKGQCGAASCK
jgi:hypothetical protein